MSRVRFFFGRGGSWYRRLVTAVDGQYFHCNLELGGLIIDVSRRGGFIVEPRDSFLAGVAATGDGWVTLTLPMLLRDPWTLLEGWPVDPRRRRVRARDVLLAGSVRALTGGAVCPDPFTCVTLTQKMLGLPVHAQAPGALLRDLITLHGGRIGERS